MLACGHPPDPRHPWFIADCRAILSASHRPGVRHGCWLLHGLRMLVTPPPKQSTGEVEQCASTAMSQGMANQFP